MLFNSIYIKYYPFMGHRHNNTRTVKIRHKLTFSNQPERYLEVFKKSHLLPLLLNEVLRGMYSSPSSLPVANLPVHSIRRTIKKKEKKDGFNKLYELTTTKTYLYTTDEDYLQLLSVYMNWWEVPFFIFLSTIFVFVNLHSIFGTTNQ